MEFNNKIFSDFFTYIKLTKKRPTLIFPYLLKWRFMG